MDPRIGNWQFQKVKSEAAFRLTMKKNAVDSEQYCGVPSCSKCGKREKNTTLKQHSGLCAVCSAPRCDAPDEEFYGKVIENPTPKFKVGDRVKYIGQVFGEILKPDVEYTVRTVCKISGLELYGLECAYFKTSRFELIPSTPQIDVSKIEKGDWVKCQKFDEYPSFADSMHQYIDKWMRLGCSVFDSKHGKMFIGDDGWQWPVTSVVAHSKTEPSDA